MDVPKKLYLAGPMTGYSECNMPAFERARNALRTDGYEVICPAELNEALLAEGAAREVFLSRDIPLVVSAEGIVLLEGWTASQGANTEALVAWQCGKPAFMLLWDETTRSKVEKSTKYILKPISIIPERLPYSTDTDDDRDSRSILQAADSLINGARRDSYGHPLDDYTRVAAMVTGLFHNLLKPGCSLSPEHIPMIMACMKLSREVQHSKRGNRIDSSEYIGLIDMIVKERDRRLSLGIPVVECKMAMLK